MRALQFPHFFGSTAAFLIFGIFIIHFYWLLGGNWGLSVSLPETSTKTKPLKPGVFMTLIVALAFLLMAIIVLDIDFLTVSKTTNFYLSLAIAVVFLLRSIGDFKYFGFFRKIKSTDFSKYDTKIFTPLSLFIGILIMIKLFIL